MPIDLLKREQQRLSGELKGIERALKAAAGDAERIEATVKKAVGWAEDREAAYRRASPIERWLINQAFFSRAQ